MNQGSVPASAQSTGRSAAPRIAILSEGGEFGGVEAFCKSLAEAFARRGAAVTLVSLQAPVFRHLSFVPGVDVRHYDAGGQVGFLPWREQYRLLRQIPADAGVLVKSWMYVGSWRFDLTARRVWQKYYTVEQVLPPLPDPGSLSYKARVGLMLRGYLAHGTVAVSREVKARLCDTYGYPARRVHVFPNGADPARFFFNDDNRAAIRAQWSVADDFVFGVVCRLAPEKRVDRVIRAFHQLLSARGTSPVRPRLVIVGGGSEEPALRQLVDELALASSVRFEPATPTPERVFSAVDTFLLTSDLEGLPLALCEAMATERVAIATDIAGNREVITDASVGRLVPKEDLVRLTEAMQWAMCLSPEERRRIGESARRHVVKEFNQRSQLQRVIEMVERDLR